MEKMTLGEIAAAADGRLIPANAGQKAAWSVTADSRNCKEGSLFLAIKGENFDGHDFVRDAFAAGAVAAVAEREVEGGVCILVKDTRKALLDIAAAYRAKFDIPVVGVTGSTGKTTTKEMICAVLSTQYSTHKNEGNYNNDIGVPLTLLKLDSQHQAAVIEMGMNHAGEISRLSKAVKPTIGVITNIGTAHIENLGSREGILKAKLEITHGMDGRSRLVLNGDDDMLWGIANELGGRTFYFGIDNGLCDVQAKNIVQTDNKTIFDIHYAGKDYPASVNYIGRHNVMNALAAFSAGVLAGISPENAAKGLSMFENTGMRQRIEKIDGITIINDCYNANPDSMKAALNVLAQYPAKRRIAVLGDMLELGAYAEAAHKNTGEIAAKLGIDLLFACGANAEHYLRGALDAGMDRQSCFSISDKQMLGKQLKLICQDGDAILFKGSRGARMEQVLEIFAKELERA